MTASVSADVGAARVIWRFGDRWRDLRHEILDEAIVTFVTENESTTVAGIQDGWLERVPGTRSGRLDRDGERQPFGGVLAATPCGIVLVLDPVTSLRRTSRLVLVLAGAAPDWRLNAELDANVHVGPVAAAEVIAHPSAVCGARDCIRLQTSK